MTQRFPPAASQHPVHSETLPSRVVAAPVRHSKESAIVRRATLRRQRGTVERATAWIVLFVSVLGTIAALAGGWTPLIASIRTLQPNWAAIAGGFGLQSILTFLEWYYYDTPQVAWPARVFDTALTAIGYGPLVVALLISAFTAWSIPLPFYAAWGIIGFVSFLIAFYPESRLVE